MLRLGDMRCCTVAVILAACVPGIAADILPEDAITSIAASLQIDHGGGGSPGLVAGYTEESICGTLGLAAAASLKANLQDNKMKQAVLLTQEALLQGIGTNGTVYKHLCRQGEARPVFAGEMLQGLSGVKEYLAD